MGMAIVTLKITVRRAEGRNKVDALDIAQTLAELVEGVDAFEVVDEEGEDATYEVSRVTLVIDPLELESVSPADVVNCQWCDVPVPRLPGFRRKVFCTDAHRQAAYRFRRSQTLPGHGR
jgi:hypothetical protein